MDPETQHTQVIDAKARRIGWSRRTWILAAVLTVAVAALLTAATTVALDNGPSLANQPMAVADTEATNFFTLDYKNIDSELNAVLSLSTGTFKNQYQQNSAAVKKGIVSAKLTSTASIPANSTAIEFETTSQATVLVAVDAATATATGTTQTNRYRMRIVLTKVSGNWLVSSIQQVG